MFGTIFVKIIVSDNKSKMSVKRVISRRGPDEVPTGDFLLAENEEVIVGCMEDPLRLPLFKPLPGPLLKEREEDPLRLPRLRGRGRRIGVEEYRQMLKARKGEKTNSNCTNNTNES